MWNSEVTWRGSAEAVTIELADREESRLGDWTHCTLNLMLTLREVLYTALQIRHTADRKAVQTKNPYEHSECKYSPLCFTTKTLSRKTSISRSSTPLASLFKYTRGPVHQTSTAGFARRIPFAPILAFATYESQHSIHIQGQAPGQLTSDTSLASPFCSWSSGSIESRLSL